ncbi:transposon Tf2-11 polyprotein [Trichonephila clavipes]|nr:transposon Tf2-11 polyprotein [Trichonephila clavipes]
MLNSLKQLNTSPCEGEMYRKLEERFWKHSAAVKSFEKSLKIMASPIVGMRERRVQKRKDPPRRNSSVEVIRNVQATIHDDESCNSEQRSKTQTNGKVERVNQTITTRFKSGISNSSNKVLWTKILVKVTHQYNQTPHTITGFPPTYMFGNLPSEMSLKDNEICTPIEEARKLAEVKTEQYYKINKIRYDEKFQESGFKVGDLVIYGEFHYPNTRKLSPLYSGPYTVLRKCSDLLFEIDRLNDDNKTDIGLVHSVCLRHFHSSENFQWNCIQQNTHHKDNKKIIKRNLLRNTDATEFCLTKLFGE